MKVFNRLLKFSLHYKYRFFLGILFAFITAILNAISLTTLIPIFDSLGSSGKKSFQFDFTVPEYQIIYKEKMFGENSLDGLEKGKRIIIDLKMYFNQKAKGKKPKEIVWITCIYVIPIYILKLIAYLLSVIYISTSGFLATRDIRQLLFDKIQTLPLTYFFKEKTGLLMSKIINDAEIVSAVISSNLRDAVINLFYVITHLFVLSYLNMELLLIAVIVVPIIIFPVTLFTNKITKSTIRFQEKIADLNSNIQEMISGIKVIRTFCAENFEKEKFDKINTNVCKRVFKSQFYIQVAPNLVELTSSLVVIGFFAIGANLIYSGKFTQGEFMTFLLTLLFLLRPVTQLSQMLGRISQSSAAGSRIFELIDQQFYDSTETKSGEKNVKFNNSIQFSSISFSYPGTNSEVLKNIDLKIKKGETVALVGSSGCGKSTLVDLIPKFLIPTQGEIFIDDINLNEFNTTSLREKIGIVTQDIFLFHETIADNIAYGKKFSTRKDVIRAARLAYAHDFITKMEHGYDTKLGVRGLNLSGGQRQRLVIARALLRDPEILILDEATSALDTKSEKAVNDALIRLFKNRTTLIIAHRLSTIRNIKRIIVMDDGRIAEEGDHESLLKTDGIYKKLHDHQFKDLI